MFVVFASSVSMVTAFVSIFFSVLFPFFLIVDLIFILKVLEYFATFRKATKSSSCNMHLKLSIACKPH